MNNSIKISNLFDNNSFVGYVKGVSSEEIKIHFPSAKILRRFKNYFLSYPGAAIGKFVLIEGETRGFIARILEVYIPESERKSLSEHAVENSDSIFHPFGRAELLLSFDLTEPTLTEKSVEHFPSIGDKVYSCSFQFQQNFISCSCSNSANGGPIIQLGRTVDSNVALSVHANSLFGRHCAILGTTGGGKSWSLAHLVGSFLKQTQNKIILLDATGEYSALPTAPVSIGKNAHINYAKLTNSEFCYLLAEQSPNTTATLCNAIDSLKLARILNDNSVLIKAGKSVSSVQEKINEYHTRFYQQDFELVSLPSQIRNECVKENQRGIYETYDFRLNFCSGLIARVENLIRNGAFVDLFGIGKDGSIDIFQYIDCFLENPSSKLLRIDFSKLSYEYNARELAVDLISRYLLKHARSDTFRTNPILFCVDEAHQFLNKGGLFDNNAAFSMTGVNQIAKEGRKYGLFLCIATQMPRDIPVDVMSQMGTFIIHRLINDADRAAVYKSCSSTNSSSLSYLPMLGAGEALLCGIDFPMPLLIKVSKPQFEPNSHTPSFVSSR